MATKRYTERSREYDTKSDAIWKLQKIREFYDEASGWYEIDGFVECTPSGKWIAVRVHEHRT